MLLVSLSQPKVALLWKVNGLRMTRSVRRVAEHVYPLRKDTPPFTGGNCYRTNRTYSTYFLKTMTLLTHRPRRLRRSAAIRSLVREARLSRDDFVLPLFVCAGKSVRREVSSMPGVFNLS